MSDTTTVAIGEDSTIVIATGTIGPPGPPGVTGPEGPIGPTGDAGTSGVNGTDGKGMAVFGMDGPCIVKVGTARFTSVGPATITGVIATVGTAPTGSSLIVDVKKNGTTIFTTTGNRPTIAISGNSSGIAIPDITSLSDGDYLTVDVDQVGSTVAGSDLTVQVVLT